MSFLHEDNTVAIDRAKAVAILTRLESAPFLDELGVDAAALLDEMKKAISENTAAARLQLGARANEPTGGEAPYPSTGKVYSGNSMTLFAASDGNCFAE
jgi:hypothetical protein